MKTGKAIAPPCPELRNSIDNIRYPAFVDIKLDGEFVFIHIDSHGEVFCVNKYGTTYQEFSALSKIALDVMAKHKSATFLGELCFNGGKAGTLYELLSNKKGNDLELYLFDILMLDGEDLRNFPLIDRKEALLNIMGQNGPIIPTITATEKTAVMNYFKLVTEKGYEGIVVKPLTGKLVLASCEWAKLKYKDQTDYLITSIDMTKERIEIAVPRPQSSKYGSLDPVVVGVKAPNKYKKHLKVGQFVTIEHQGVLASGSLRHPVLIAKKEWK